MSEVGTPSPKSGVAKSSPDSTGRGALRACVHNATPDCYIEVNSDKDPGKNYSSDDSADRNFAEPLSSGDSSDDEFVQTKSKNLARKPTQEEMTNLEQNLSRNTNMLA